MNVLVDAFVDNNLGDDLMLDMLVRRYPGVRFWCLRDASLNGAPPYRDWPNFLVPDWTDLATILPFMDALLVFGGSLWQDHGTNLAWYDWRRHALDAIKARGGLALAIGNSIGPVQGPEGGRLFAELLARFDLVTVRDAASMAWYERHVGLRQCTLAADLVFDYPLPSPAPAANLLGVSVHRSILYPQRNEPYAGHLAELLTRLVGSRPGLQVQLLVFNARTENDGLIASEITHRLASPPWVSTLTYDGVPASFLEGFGRCSHVFASRFHAAVLAMTMGIPFTPFDYMGKTVAMLADAGYRGPIVSHDSLGRDLAGVCERMLAPATPEGPVRVDRLREGARRHFELLDGVFGAPDATAAKRACLALLAAARATAATGGRP